jgi:hypothetical protein
MSTAYDLLALALLLIGFAAVYYVGRKHGELSAPTGCVGVHHLWRGGSWICVCRSFRVDPDARLLIPVPNTAETETGARAMKHDQRRRTNDPW